jgi:hypothetical protein
MAGEGSCLTVDHDHLPLIVEDKKSPTRFFKKGVAEGIVLLKSPTVALRCIICHDIISPVVPDTMN